ncbi:MAG: hypothetical protein COA41_12205 [Sphingopyxis sp.]|nr:MAG: hypothetical protein COA41_12205 [Sphingopyxis sp.]
MRVAFVLPPGDSWTGGINYLDNLLSVFSENPQLGITPVLFHTAETNPAYVQRLKKHLGSEPICMPAQATGRSARWLRAAGNALALKNRQLESIFREQDIDLVFQTSFWCGKRFVIPTLCWLPDFQHKHLPHFFTRFGLLKRELGYRLMSLESSCILVSSQTSRADCAHFYPTSRNKLQVLPFRVKPGNRVEPSKRQAVLAEHGIDRPYVYLPNQLWQHKNHEVVLRAIRKTLETDPSTRVLIVATGGAEDPRHPGHPDKLFDYIKTHELQDHFRFLGLVPYEHVSILMQGADYMINPSFFEGWSTTVEEARSFGKSMLLSDIPIHREQVGEDAVFFDPHDASQLAALLLAAANQELATLDAAAGQEQYQALRAEFVHRTAHIFRTAAASGK